MAPLVVIALNGFREARRNRITMLGAGFAAVMLFVGVLLADSVATVFDRVLTDIGLGLMSLMLCALAIFLGASALPDDLERRSMFLVVTRPVSRSTYVLGRAFGNMLTLWVVLTIMAAVFLFELVASGAAIRQAVAPSLLGLGVELGALTAFAFLFTSFSSKAVAAMCTAGVFFAGHFASDLYKSAAQSAPAVQAIAKAVYYALPNLERINFRGQASHDVSVAWGEVGSGIVGVVGYATLVLIVACIIMERRDFK